MTDSTTQGDIYFVAAFVHRDPDKQLPVKIGWTQNLWTRLRLLQTGCPFELDVISGFAGTKAEEKRLHEALKEFHIRGEWFSLTVDAVYAFVACDSAAECADIIERKPVANA